MFCLCLYADRTTAQMFRQGGATRMHVLQDLLPTLRGNVTSPRPGSQLTVARAQIAAKPAIKESSSGPATALPNLYSNASRNLSNNIEEVDTENLCLNLRNVCEYPDEIAVDIIAKETENMCINLLKGCGYFNSTTSAPDLNNTMDVHIATDYDNATGTPALNIATDAPVAMGLLGGKSNQTFNGLEKEMRRLKVEEIIAFLAVHAQQNKARLRMDIITAGCAVTLSGVAIILTITILCRAPIKPKEQPTMELLDMERSDPTSPQSPSWPESRSRANTNQQ